MTAYISEIARIETATGNINSISLARINPPPEGPDGTETIKHIMSDFVMPGGLTSNIEFMKYYYWDFTNSNWAYREEAPNQVATWSGIGWTWAEEDFWNLVRVQRDNYLVATDWAVLPDVQLTEAQKNQARLYRQMLRDVTLQPMPASGRVDGVSWPSKPTFL